MASEARLAWRIRLNSSDGRVEMTKIQAQGHKVVHHRWEYLVLPHLLALRRSWVASLG